MKYVFKLLILTSLIGTSVIYVNIGIFQLSLFRGLLIVLLYLILLNSLSMNTKFQPVIKKNNRFSIQFMMFWFLYALITIGWVKDYVGWIKSVYFLGIGILLIIIMITLLKTKYDILKTLKIFSFMIIIHNFIGWYEINTGNYIFLTDGISKIDYYLHQYPVSMFGNTNNYAVFLMFSIFILYICIINTKKKLFKLIYIGSTISSVILLFYTESRASILGLVIALITFTLNSFKKSEIRKILFVLLPISAIFLILNPSIIANVYNTIVDDFNDQSSSNFIRMNLLINGIQILFSTYGFGTGAGNIEYWMFNYGELPTAGITNIHNWWGEILVGYGVVIFIFYCIFYFKLFKALKKKFKQARDKVDQSISLGLVSIMTGFIVASVSASSNIGSEWLWLFWAICIAYQGIELEHKIGLS